MYNFSNSAKFGMNTNTERYLWIGWLTFLFVSSLLGDSLILIASIKYKAFNLHKMIVTFIQHIAVTDLLHSLGAVAPAIISAIYNTGSTNRFIDYARFFITYYTSALSSLLICALALGKLLLLKYPLQLRFLSKMRAHKLCTVIWVVSLYDPGLHLVVKKEDIIFDYRVYSCTYKYTSSVWKILLPVSAFLVLVAPGVTIVVSPWCFHLDMPRNKSRGTKSRGAISFLSADNARKFYQCHVVQVSMYNRGPRKERETVRKAAC